ncbi:MAG TPA: oxalurate catabolism protein HpxZ [Stellaceae bacterium]|nr:oxalurate catabolism protein HpxZ [Stellaceae bacterium]
MIINDPKTLAEVTAAFQRYETALLSNDIDVLDELFWTDPRTVRLGIGENLYGIEQIRGFRVGRVGGSPQRSLRNTVITTYGTDFGTANTEFIRVNSDKIGRQSHTWLRRPEGWRIVAAHVSFMAGTS